VPHSLPCGQSCWPHLRPRREHGTGDRRPATTWDILTSAAWTAPNILHIPESLPESVPVPLVLVFHGGGGHAATMPNFTRFDSRAEREKFLLAYPERSPADDVGFIRAP
jgi:poly(3-hydroxybutyrate) depolymerase